MVNIAANNRGISVVLDFYAGNAVAVDVALLEVAHPILEGEDAHVATCRK
jgi:hypothetical protein